MAQTPLNNLPGAGTRDYFIPGQSMVYVQQVGNTALQLGLSDQQIQFTPTYRDEDIQVNAWGGQVPPEVQQMGAEVQFSMTLIHFDQAVLRGCLGLASAGTKQYTNATTGNSLAGAEGVMPAPGARLAGSWVTLGCYCPATTFPTQTGTFNWWRFPMAKIVGNLLWPIGAEKSIVRLQWRCLPAPLVGGLLTLSSFDPWNSGNGMQGAVLWDHTAMV